MWCHFEVVKVLILAKADVRIKNKNGKLPHVITRKKEIREFIWLHHPWYRRRSLILTRPPHRSHRRYPMSPLAYHIITATLHNLLSSHDKVLFQFKIKIAESL